MVVPVIEVVTSIVIHASPEKVFDLARDVKTHEKTTAWTNEKVVECSTDSLLEEGDTVTFEARHFGITQRLTSKVTKCDRPRLFVDHMQKGAFKSLRHEHVFEEIPDGTRMTDRLVLEAPLGVLGWITERLFLATYMRRFIHKRNTELKRLAESL